MEERRVDSRSVAKGEAAGRPGGDRLSQRQEGPKELADDNYVATENLLGTGTGKMVIIQG